jgi:hypothetical protein
MANANEMTVLHRCHMGAGPAGKSPRILFQGTMLKLHEA